MKKIVYYLTDHGLGHATRAVALIRELKNLNLDIVVRTTTNQNFIENSFDNIKTQSGITDVGPTIKNDGKTIDVSDSKPKIESWIKKIPEYSKNEIDFLKKVNPSLIISDISAMPFLASKKLNIPSLALSNFSWYDVLEFISEKHRELLKTYYDFADNAIKLPFGTPMEHFNQKFESGILTRYPSSSKLEIREKLGIKKQDFVVTIALGNPKKSVLFDFKQKCKIISFDKNVNVNSDLILLENFVEGQNLVSISDFVICKCGYGLVSECVTNGIPFYYISDNKHLEQKAISDELISKNLGKKISLKISQSNLFSIESMKKIEIPKKEKIDNASIANFLNQLIN